MRLDHHEASRVPFSSFELRVLCFALVLAILIGAVAQLVGML